ncbi:MAG: phytoene desaturase family protein [Bacteroidota bacterium]
MLNLSRQSLNKIMKTKHAIVIGSGVAGLSAASYLARKGMRVTVLEKNATPGGRARKFEAEGFMFDMGPRWYWMPDVFEKFYNDFGKTTADFYELKRLDPSYKVFWKNGEGIDIPADMQQLELLFERFESGSGKKIRAFLKEAAYKYEVGINDLVYKPSLSLLEFADMRLLNGLVKMDVFTSMKKHVRSFVSHPFLIELLEFPILFLGALPANTPALYSLMNYADMSLGTWYPMGGMHKIIEAFVSIAQSQGVELKCNAEVTAIETITGKAKRVITARGETLEADVVVGAGDYHHIDQNVLGKNDQSYTPQYWDSRKLAPSCLLYYVGLNTKLKNLTHHNLFFDADFMHHAKEIYEHPKWPADPLFYASVPSITDPTVAPHGMENLFLLIPVAPGLTDTEEIKEQYFNLIMQRLEERTQQSIRPHVVYKRSYAMSNFVADYHAFKGNAYGLANTLMQTAILKPRMKSKKVSNLYYAGQLTVPGPGVPPSIISGKVVANLIEKEMLNA